MKNYFNFIVALSVFTALLVGSCQNEENRTAVNPEALDKNSELTQLLKRLAMNETAADNVLDSTSCFSVKLPVSAVVNNVSITVTTSEDYALVKSLFLQSSTDADELEFVFPITLINAAYEEVIVESEVEFNNLTQSCISSFGDRIKCMNLEYPLTVYSYSPDFQSQETNVFNSDAEFFLFLYNLDENQFFSIDYPVATIDSAGNPITYTNAISFYEGINAAIEECLCDNEAALTTDLIMYVPFSGEAVDLTGNSAVNVAGAHGYITDRSGNPFGALSLISGSESNFVSIPGGPQSNFLQSGKFTISMWFNRQNSAPLTLFENLMTTESISLQLGSVTNNGVVYGPLVVNSGAPETMYDNDWVANGLLGDIGQWHHLVVTYDGTILLLYRDGVIRNASAEAEFASSIPGADWGGNFKGFIDDIRVYKSALTQQEVQLLYNMQGDVSTCL